MSTAGTLDNGDLRHFTNSLPHVDARTGAAAVQRPNATASQPPPRTHSHTLTVTLRWLARQGRSLRHWKSPSAIIALCQALARRVAGSEPEGRPTMGSSRGMVATTVCALVAAAGATIQGDAAGCLDPAATNAEPGSAPAAAGSNFACIYSCAGLRTFYGLSSSTSVCFIDRGIGTTEWPPAPVAPGNKTWTVPIWSGTKDAIVQGHSEQPRDGQPTGRTELTSKIGVVLGASLRLRHVRMAGVGSDAVYVHGTNARLWLEHAAFEHNLGAPVYVSDRTAEVSILGCTFTSNIEDDDVAAAILIEYAQNVSIIRSTFTNNSGEDRGALYFDDVTGTVSIVGCSFINNTCSDDDGGAIYVEDVGAVSIVDSSFINNTAAVGAAVFVEYNVDSVAITGCSFVNNSAAEGSAIALSLYDAPAKFAVISDCSGRGNRLFPVAIDRDPLPVLLTEKELLVGIGDRWEYISVVAEDKPCALENLPRNVTRGNCPASGLVTNGAQCEPACQTRLFGHKESRCANGLLKWQGVCDDAPCAHNPCLHGGECGEFDHDGQKQSQCACTAGWTGPTCNSRDYCSDPGLCKHGSTCDNGNPLYPLSYFCDCFRTGYTGRHCDQPVCRHNGLYLAGQGKYTNNLPLREPCISNIL